MLIINAENNDITNLKVKEFIWRLQEEQYYDALEVLYEYNDISVKKDYISEKNWDILIQLLSMVVLLKQDRYSNKENLKQLYNNISKDFDNNSVLDFSKDIWLKSLVANIFTGYFLLIDEDIEREGINIKDFDYSNKIINELCENENILNLLNSFFEKIDNKYPFEYDNIYTDSGILSLVNNNIKYSNCFK